TACMTLSIWPLVRTSDQTCSCTKTPSYCTRQARATLDTVSPVESDTRWTWKFRFATALFYPTPPRGETQDWRGQGGDRRTVLPDGSDSGHGPLGPIHLSSLADRLGG